MPNYKAPNAHPRQLVATSDGSNTLFIPELNEHYHSTFGALQESEFIFIFNVRKNIFPFWVTSRSGILRLYKIY